MYIDVHILQTVPFSNLNRDDAGMPKTLVMGGTLRSRVSSQSWKRATRLSLESAVASAKTYRTRHPDNRLAELLVAEGIDEETAAQIAAGAFRVIGTKKDKDVVGLYSEQELAALVPVALEYSEELAALHDAKDATSKKDLRKLLTDVLAGKRATSVALFGRMLADNTAVNVDGATQFSHPFSVNEIEFESDFFTATEDLANEDQGNGGAHMGYGDFVTATYYRFMTLNVIELLDNCGGDVETTLELARACLFAFCVSMPSGKNNATAPHSLPEIVNIAVRPDRPVSYSTAYEGSLKPGSDGYAGAAAEALSKFAPRAQRMLPVAPALAGFVNALNDEMYEGLGQGYDSLSALVDDAVRVAGEDL